MSDSKAAAELIRELKSKGYTVVQRGQVRRAVVVGKRLASIPGPTQKVAGRAMANVRAKLRREYGIDV